jgi:hypothetical protein
LASKKYTIYSSTSSAVPVKSGFCWTAFFFGGLWAAAKRMWFPYFIAMSVADIVIWFATGYAKAQGNGGLALLSALAMFAYAIMRGKFGNRWLANSLLSRGYTARTSTS